VGSYLYRAPWSDSAVKEPRRGSHSGMVRRTRPQMRDCASGNLEIPGSLVALAPWNDDTHAIAVSPRDCTRVMPLTSPFANRGRGECRVPNAPAASCALGSLSMRTSIHSGGTGKHPAFPTQWFYGLLRALPGDHRFVDPVIRATRWRLANLTPASGRQNHTTSPSASKALVSRSIAATASHPNVHDDRETPLLWRRDRRSKSYISEKRKRNIFRGRAGQDFQNAG